MWSVDSNTVERYNAAVNRALNDDPAFTNFKSDNDYIAIVGTPSPYQLRHFQDKINKFPEVTKELKTFMKNDIHGNPPHMVDFMGEKVSMGTIRYIHSICDLKDKFGSLDDMIISEMGVGYGGLAYAINSYWKPKAYHLIDLPPVQQLASKYLTELGVSALMTPPPEEVDLFISEFCLSEFDDEDLYKFFEKYVRNARNAYLQMNLIDESRKQRFITHMNEEFGLEIYSETHGTAFPAYVIVGKKDQ